MTPLRPIKQYLLRVCDRDSYASNGCAGLASSGRDLVVSEAENQARTASRNARVSVQDRSLF